MNYSLGDAYNHIVDLSTDLIFQGTVEELPKDADLGAVVLCEDKTWINTDTRWTVINPSYENTTITTCAIKEEVHIVYPSNCKNCGAILHDNICEYCGSDNGEYKRY